MKELTILQSEGFCRAFRQQTFYSLKLRNAEGGINDCKKRGRDFAEDKGDRQKNKVFAGRNQQAAGRKGKA